MITRIFGYNTLHKAALKATTLRRVLSWYPPYLGAGVNVDYITDDFTSARVSMPLTWYNKNIVGTHFGGSLYSMCDPMFMLLLMNHLGQDYIVWDKAASIEYKQPGRGKVTAEFTLSKDLLAELQMLAPDEKKFVELSVDVLNEAGEVVATVLKTEYIRRKPLKTPVDL
jgi:acyl-coenzyme A thioesterase PaaI-like protein